MNNLLITYDIEDNKKRRKVAKILDDYGDRVQKSVFELPGLDDIIWKKCLERMKKIQLEPGESIRIYKFCEKCKKIVTILGEGEAFSEPDIYII